MWAEGTAPHVIPSIVVCRNRSSCMGNSQGCADGSKVTCNSSIVLPRVGPSMGPEIQPQRKRATGKACIVGSLCSVFFRIHYLLGYFIYFVFCFCLDWPCDGARMALTWDNCRCVMGFAVSTKPNPSEIPVAPMFSIPKSPR